MAHLQDAHGYGIHMPATRLQDTPELVRMPEPMQQRTLANMRDHLRALDAVLANNADGKFDDAATLAAARLGMSSLVLRRDAQMAPFMPKPMQEMGTAMHLAASGLVIVV